MTAGEARALRFHPRWRIARDATALSFDWLPSAAVAWLTVCFAALRRRRRPAVSFDILTEPGLFCSFEVNHRVPSRAATHGSHPVLRVRRNPRVFLPNLASVDQAA